MKKALSDVLRKIKPSKDEEKAIKYRIDALLIKINHNLKDANAILGGSGIKGTWLREANDADIFVKFKYNKYKNKSQELSEILEKILKKKKLKATKLHGSRDYFQIKKEGFTFEIVPILGIKNAKQAENITDVSPLHANWVNKKGKKFKDDIRLLKQFCKAADVYGAESYIQGFSGYICEILAIHYKGFINTIKNAARWKGKVIIDPEKYWKNRNILLELNKSKICSPLILIDPVQADRNAAAALSEEKFELFKKKAKEFLKRPSEQFFEIKEIDENMLKKKAGNNELILIEAEPKKGKRDVVGCKLIKALEFIVNKLKQNDFDVIDYGWKWNKKALFYCIIKKEKLGDKIKVTGPPIKLEAHVKNFKKKYGKTFIKNNVIYAEIKRKFKKPKEVLSSLKEDVYLKDKIDGFIIK